MSVHARIAASCLVLLAALSSVGCLMHRISYDFPDYEPTKLENVPDRVLASFTRTYPHGQIQHAESRISPPTGNTYFRFEFLNEGELWESEIREDGSFIEGYNRPMKQGDEQQLSVEVGATVEPKEWDNMHCLCSQNCNSISLQG